MTFKFEAQNLSSQYIGVSWDKQNKKWQVQLQHNKKRCFGGLFGKERDAAMKVNLLCDEFGILRKNPMVDIQLDEIPQVTNPVLQKIHFPHLF